MKNANISKADVLKDLYSKQRFGIKPGLERTLLLSESVGDPHKNLRFIHVAGTNGKGSICSSIASILMESGYKTGLYTSPHLVDFNERIRVNNYLIADEELIDYYLKLKPISDELGATFFEITTVIAFMYFNEQNVDFAVIETGMGGKYDSTNIIKPILSIISKIDLDHKEYLGDTIELIAEQKAGIIKIGVPCIVSENSAEVIEVIKKYADLTQIIKSNDVVGCELINNSIDNPIYKTDFLGKSSFNFEFAIPGKFQYQNLQTVLCAIDLLKSEFNISNDSIQSGLKNIVKNTGLSARIQIINTKPIIILDASHNSNSILNLAGTLEYFYPDKKWCMIFAIMKDKDNCDAIDLINNFAYKLILPKIKNDRALSPNEITSKVNPRLLSYTYITDCTQHAVEMTNGESNILYFGSFFLIGEVIEILNK